MPGPVFLPRDGRAAQCKRAADFMEAKPGCTIRELETGADLGSPTKVISEMVRKFGYGVRRERRAASCLDGTRYRRVTRYWLESRPNFSQGDLFESA
jgi:hypothetical protein